MNIVLKIELVLLVLIGVAFLIGSHEHRCTKGAVPWYKRGVCMALTVLVGHGFIFLTMIVGPMSEHSFSLWIISMALFFACPVVTMVGGTLYLVVEGDKLDAIFW